MYLVYILIKKCSQEKAFKVQGDSCSFLSLFTISKEYSSSSILASLTIGLYTLTQIFNLVINEVYLL